MNKLTPDTPPYVDPNYGPNAKYKNGHWISDVPGITHTFHVFDDENRSLCGKYAIVRFKTALATKLMGNEVYVKGQDCKACFIKAKLLIK